MKQKYLFLFNSNKPTKEQYESKEDYVLNNFSIPNVEAALSMGYEVYMGINRKYASEIKCKNYPVKFYDASIYRSILNIKDNLKAYRNLKKFLKEKKIDVIHANTPLGGFFGRMLGHKFKVPKIIYTAHGFHFFKGNNKLKNFIFRSVEKFLARRTDVIITMNEEDYNSSLKFNLKNNGNVYKVNGVGINTETFKNIDINNKTLRNELMLKEDSKICISLGDLVKRKNYDVAIKAFSKIKDNDIHYIICGLGPDEKRLKKLSKKLNTTNNIHFLGYRHDTINLLKESDLFLITTLQEGLPRSLMEGMASGLPVVASNVRGNNDLIKDNIGGLLCNANDANCFAKKIEIILNDKRTIKKMSIDNLKTMKNYDVNIVKKQIKEIYLKEI